MPQGPDLRIVAVGDSLTQGTQDAETVQERQEHVYVKQLANQAGLTFNLPDLDGEGIPFGMFHDHTLDATHFLAHVLKLGLAVAPLGIYTYFVGAPHVVIPTWDAVPGFGQRTPESRNTPQHPQGDFAVGGYQLRHVTGVRNMQDYLKEIHVGLQSVIDVGMEVPLIRATLGNGQNSGEGSAADQAVKQDPDLVVAWAGNNDALSAVFNGRLDDSILTPVGDQKWHYQVSNPITGATHEVTTKNVLPGFRSQMKTLVDKFLNGTHAEVMLFNIPDVTCIPLAREVGKPVGKLPFRVVLVGGQDVTNELENWTIPTTIKGDGHNGRTQFPPGSRVALTTVLQKILLSGVPKDLGELQTQLASKALLGEDDVLDPDELNAIQQHVDQFNQVIADEARANPRVHLVDIHAVLADALANGRPLKGAGPDEWVAPIFTGAPDAQGRDGIFGYDGVHPSDTGHAVVANVLLEAIQRELGGNPKFARFLNTAPVDEKAVHHQDPHTQGPSSAAASIVLEPGHIDEFANRISF